MDLKGIESEGADWICVAQDMKDYRDGKNRIMKLPVP
jgi:hypothetical protein